MTKIGWVNAPGFKSQTLNLWHGCTKISPGCKNCYAEPIAKNRLKSVEKYDGTIKYFLDRLESPLYWKKPTMIFVNSMSDLFHEKIPFEIIEKLYEVMYKAKQHIFQILTKRPERMLNFYSRSMWLLNSPPKNIWLGVSVESPEYLHRIETLLQIPAAVRFVSFEPLLEDIGNIIDMPKNKIDFEIIKEGALPDFAIEYINWVIIGCESGPCRRPCNLDWVYNIVAQCQDANVWLFVKQIEINGKVERDINKFPKELQFQEFPIILNTRYQNET